MTVHDDLATLRSRAMTSYERVGLYVDRVEAKIARLEQERDEALRRSAMHQAGAEIGGQELYDRWQAAEAEIARLRDGLRRIEQMALRDESGIVSVARALLETGQ